MKNFFQNYKADTKENKNGKEMEIFCCVAKELIDNSEDIKIYLKNQILNKGEQEMMGHDEFELTKKEEAYLKLYKCFKHENT